MISLRKRIIFLLLYGHLNPLSVQGIAIFALMFTYFLWIKAVKTGSVFWGSLTAISYFYMARYAL